MSRSTRSESERREVVASWRRSGVSAAEYAAQLGVSVHTLYAWAGRVRRDSPKLVELIATPPDVRSREDGGCGGCGGDGGDEMVEITLRNGRVLRAPLGVDGERLGRLIVIAESA